MVCFSMRNRKESFFRSGGRRHPDQLSRETALPTKLPFSRITITASLWSLDITDSFTSPF